MQSYLLTHQSVVEKYLLWKHLVVRWKKSTPETSSTVSLIDCFLLPSLSVYQTQSVWLHCVGLDTGVFLPSKWLDERLVRLVSSQSETENRCNIESVTQDKYSEVSRVHRVRKFKVVTLKSKVWRSQGNQFHVTPVMREERKKETVVFASTANSAVTCPLFYHWISSLTVVVEFKRAPHASAP